MYRSAKQAAPIVNCWTKLIISIIILLFSVDDPSQKIKDSLWYHMFIARADLAHFDLQGATRFFFASRLQE
jgi:hypothetical protein